MEKLYRNIVNSLRGRILKQALHKFYHLVFLGLNAVSCSKSDISSNENQMVPKLPDTGQVSSYTSTYGEDSDFSINPPSFTNNGNGTITDNITGLMWQKTDGGEMTFEKTTGYIDTLRLGGYKDWRLPSGFELFGLNNYDKINPALNTGYFTLTNAEYWWTSEKRIDDPSMVWVVNAGGGIGAHPKTETITAGGTKRFHVRAVRNTQTSVGNHFKDNGDGTVSDYITGLIWQKTNNSGTLTWEAALVFAENLSLAGKTDWRIPNIKELQSLNDPSLCKPSFNKTYFPGMLSGNFWSSTSMVNNTVKAWDINVDYGIVSYNDKTVKEYVLCVRGGI